MKIGILTFHCAHNYGAVLQCYALQEYLKLEGHDVKVLDYRPYYITSDRSYQKFSIRFFITRNLKLFPKVLKEAIYSLRYRTRKWNKFEDFINSRLQLIPVDKIAESELDLVVVGSDQIWNPNITDGKFDKIFFGKGINAPVISYAASSMVDSYSENEKHELRELLSGMKAISVRENSLSALLKDVLGYSPTVVLDPTLLIGNSLFDRFVTPTIYKEKPYLLVYVVKDDPNIHIVANRVAKELNLQVIEIASNFSLERKSQKIYDAGVEDFISLISNADCVVTNSFHGTALSILLRKDFLAVRRHQPIDDRISQILDNLNLTDRFIEPDSPQKMTSVDYREVHKLLKKIRTESKNFLRNNI